MMTGSNQLCNDLMVRAATEGSAGALVPPAVLVVAELGAGLFLLVLASPFGILSSLVPAVACTLLAFVAGAAVIGALTLTLVLLEACVSGLVGLRPGGNTVFTA